MAASEIIGTLQSQLQNEDYQYWIKAGMCLSILRKCLEELADITSRELYHLVLSELSANDIQTYSTCKRHIAGYRTSSLCPRSCALFENTVRKYHRNQLFPIKRINVERLTVDPWEVAKLFMGPVSQLSTNPYDVDFGGLLSFLSNCRISVKYIQHTECLDHVRHVRNAIMHSVSMKVNRSQFLEFTDSMIDLLRDPIYLAGLPLAQNAVLEIQKVRQASFQVLKAEESEGTKILTIAPTNDDEDTKSEEGERSAPFSYSIQEYNTQKQTDQSKADSSEVLTPLQIKASLEDPQNILDEDTKTCTDTELETQRAKLLQEQYYEEMFVKLKSFFRPILKKLMLENENVRTPQMDEATEKIKQYLGRLTKSIQVAEPKQESIHKQDIVSYMGRLTKSIPEDEPKQESIYKQGVMPTLSKLEPHLYLTLPRTLFYISAQLLSSDTISKIIKFYGLRSTYGDSLLSWLCARIREFSTRVIRVWVGYEMGLDNNPLFVAVVSEIDKSLSANFQTLCQFPVLQRVLDDVSDEAKLCMKEEIDNSFTLLEHSDLHEAIVKNSEELMKSHSNLLMISASALKSSKDGNKIEIKTCIVLYVHIKGIIPLKERPFPLKIGKFPVDVREGIVNLYSDAKLTIGCNIASAYMCGRLGGFVHLSNGKVGCITCSHLFDTTQSRQDRFQGTFNGKVFIRSTDGQLYHFGHLIEEVIRPGDRTIIGVDAALIEITDRRPDDGSFETTEIPLDTDSEQPSGFHSGEILTSPQEIVELQTNKNAKCKIIRYDDTNKRMYICTGFLKVSGTTIDAYYPATVGEKCLLHGQMEIFPCPPAKKFANPGDSGALVFLVNEHTDDIWAIGMVVAGVNSGASIVTPIWAILESFNLPKKLLSFENKRIQKIEHGMKYIQKQMESMHQQTQTLAGMHQKTQQDLTAMNNQTRQDLASMRHQIQQDMDGRLNPIQHTLSEILSCLNPK